MTKNTNIKPTEDMNTRPAEMISHDTVDISQITDPTLRALMENLVRQTKEREEQLQAELHKIQAELAESRIRELKHQPPTVVWNRYMEEAILRLEANNPAPLTPRQKKILSHSVRIIARECSGKYRLNRKDTSELLTMKAVADKLIDTILEFGVPEEIDPVYQRISDKKDGRAKRNK